MSNGWRPDIEIPPTPNDLIRAAGNVTERLLRRRLADVTPQPSDVIDEGPQRRVLRYRTEATDERMPVLLVPPLASPAFVFDLRRGCSLVEHLLELGRTPYLVDYGQISFDDRRLGLEHWTDEVLPQAIAAVSADVGDRPVHLVGWCLGGTLCALSTAADHDLPVASLTMVASPIDSTRVPLMTPIRTLVDLSGSMFVTAAYRTLGTAPGPLVKRAFQVATIDRYLTRPLRLLQNLDNRDYLEQVEAVDRMMDNMIAYPGRVVGQLYHDLFRANKLASGRIELGGRMIDLRELSQPLLSIAGEDDGIAPAAAVHHIKNFVPQAQLESAPGGHVSVLTGAMSPQTTWPLITSFLDDVDSGSHGARQQKPRRKRWPTS